MKKILLVVLGALFFMQEGYSQQIAVSGKVISSEGVPLSGVSVKIKKKNTGTSTSTDGTYSIKADKTDVLVFSYVGYAAIEKEVGSQSIINVQMSEDVRTLTEVAVTAFGVKQKVRSLGFSTQNVKANEVVESQQPNIVNALQGKAAGVQITNSSGAPGASSSIMIRGGNSLSGNNQPLFVVDGIPIDNSTPVGQGGLVASYGPATNRAIDINPEDIASITILKGPAAAALYGIRAASGAIIITTKKGSGGAARITYQGTFSMDNVNRLPKLQSQFKQGALGLANPTAPYSWGPAFAPGDTIYDNLKDFFKTAFTQSHDLSMSGSSEKSNYYASGSYFDQGAITNNSDFKRGSFRINSDTKVGEKLTVGVSANYVRTDRHYVPQGDANGVMGALYWPRNDNMKNYLDANGKQRVVSPTGNDNPYWSIQNKPITSLVNRIITVGNLDYNPFQFLNITYRLGTDYYNETFKSVNMPTGSFKGSVNQSISNNQITTSTLIATFKKTVKSDFNFSLSLGHNLESSSYRSTTSSAIRFIDPSFPSINNTVATDRSVSEYLSRRRIVGLFGDFNFNWKEIVYLNARGRNDWSSTLPIADNSFFYPALSASVIFTDLLKITGMKNDDRVFSYGKIRAAYSEVGKDAPPHVLTSSLQTVTNTFTINPRGFITNANNAFGNPALLPEFTKAFEAGADLRFFNNRYGIDFTYFRSQSDNQILATRTPPAAGAFLTYLNGGSIRNEGVEIVLNARPVIQRNFKWSIDINFAHNTSIVKALPGLLDRVELSDAWTNNNAAEAAAFLNGSLFGINGQTFKKNSSGQLLLDNKGAPQLGGYSNIGDRNPDFTAGITNTFNYKDFMFSFMVDIRQGGKVFNATEVSLVLSGLSTKTIDRGTRVYDGIIESTGLKNTLAIPLNQDYYRLLYANQGYDFVEDGGWVRLRYVALSYNVPKQILGKSKIKGLSFTATGRNLILLTKYSGIDPEVSGSGAGVGGSGSFGFDNLGVPATRGVDLGIKLTF
ncbi:MAG: SusC/RagA family TonB-linked outer membrane protein [Bacteroidetes bacterium]|nr:SusC/RagA family TonB-linked outer membrane protein [Bacteroidota bacterium]